jgi:hypothetical protein
MDKSFLEIAYRWDNQSQTLVPTGKHAERFLKGPVPMSWLAAAAQLPGKALAVGLALWRLAGATKSKTVRLGNTEMDEWGVDRSAKSRALHARDQAGLIKIEQRPGCLPLVTILSTKA